ncbi:AGAP013213-PA-like protein [Anopheles sinensis]|uniref:AGAP013213-PA-like protein n=1 Tax=Anopheles sinensis TaxID=74873 RepID=A0A084VBG7_ANOSI|nr:AGAP013213-PA-like protein [Anopheles sinensis]
MFNALKDQALEIDSKIGRLRKHCTTFATGYVEEDASKQDSVREKLTAAGNELRDTITDCDRLVEQTHALFTLLTEADKVADEIYDSVIKLYLEQGVKVPPIDLDTIAVGFPIDLLPLPEPSSVVNRSAGSDSENEAAEEEEHSTDDSEILAEDFEAEVHISRLPGEDSLAPETPMIKSRKRLF